MPITAALLCPMSAASLSTPAMSSGASVRLICSFLPRINRLRGALLAAGEVVASGAPPMNSSAVMGGAFGLGLTIAMTV